MEKAIKNWYAMSDPAILEVLGNFIQQTRLQQNKTQQQVAAAAGINRSTMVQIENGGGGTLISNTKGELVADKSPMHDSMIVIFGDEETNDK